MDNTIHNIIKENKTIGKGSFGIIYYNKTMYPNYIVKKMHKYNNYGNNFLLNNIKELWWYSLLKKHDKITTDKVTNTVNLENIHYNNIPKLLNYHVDSEYIYLLMEHKGVSLHTLTKDIYTDKLDCDRYIETLKLIPMIIYTCSKIFMMLHYANMRHGDITISNIMYNKHETNKYKQISIVDWGSLVFTKLTLNNYNQCAPEYMAPELDNNKLCDCDIIQKPSIKSDIFSLGLIILYILDPSKTIGKHYDKYLQEYDMMDNISHIIDDIINFIKNKYKFIDIEQHIDARVFYLVKKMLDVNTNTRIDIDSLYMDELFSNFRKDESSSEGFVCPSVCPSDVSISKEGTQENDFDPCYLNKIIRIHNPIVFDDHKNILVEHTHQYLKTFKTKTINNLRNSKYYKSFDTRVILFPSLQLFYNYLNISNTIENKSKYNINHYLMSFMCCIKWIDILFNDDISIYHLYEFYTHLYSIFNKILTETLVLDLNNFMTFFDLTFYNIFDIIHKNDNVNILIYPYILDFKYDYVNHNDIKKMLTTVEYL